MNNVAKTFKNCSDEEFIGVWNKEEWRFAPGQHMTLQSYLADHFAKHFVVREINKMISKGDLHKGKNELRTDNPDLVKEILDKCLFNTSIEAESQVKLESKIINKEEKEIVKESTETKEELIKKADELGLKVDKRMSKETIMQTIDDAINEKKSYENKKIDEDDFEGLN